MRSNGAVHIGNDTFVTATRDCTSHIFLVTSAFPKEERLAPLRLTRRTRIIPNSSLGYDPEEVKRFTNAYQKYSEQKGEGIHVNTSTSPKVSEKAPSSQSVRAEGGRGSDRTDHKAVALQPPLLELGESSQEVLDTAKDEDWAFFLRHSLHASPDAHRIAAMSNTRHRHYIINIGEPTDIFPFETSETVRSVCWHPEQTHLLLLLLVSGVLMVCDTTAPSFYFKSCCIYQVALKPLIRSVLEREASKSLPTKSKEKSASRTEPSQLSHTSMVNEAAALTAKEGEVEEAGMVSNDSPRSSSKGHRASMLIDDFRMPTKGFDNGTTSAWTKAQNSSARVGLLRDVQEIRRTGQPVLKRPLAMLPVGSNRAEAFPGSLPRRSQRPAKVADVATAGEDDGAALIAHPRKDSLSQTLPPKEDAGAQRTRAASSVSPAPSLPLASRDVILREKPVTGLIPIMGDSPSSGEFSPLELVDMCCVRPTRGLPTILLLLCSGGDVFTVKLDNLSSLAMGAAVSRDGRLPLNAQETEAARRRDEELARMPDIHHLLPNRTDLSIDSYGEEALALTCFCIDEDAGTHALLVCYSSGILRGLYVDEPDLLARDGALPVGARPAAPRASFQLHLFSPVEVRALVSPATAPTTTHTIHLTTVGNLCLLICGLNEAFVVAVPVWSRARGGWSYYSPPCGLPERREAESLRLCLGGVSSEVPPPLALRVPYDVAEASLALGDTELVIIPEVKEGGTACLREHIIAVKVASLLQSALFAQAGDLSCCYGPGLSPEGDLPRRDAATASGDGKAVPRETSVEDLEGLLRNVVRCHREWLCGFPPDEVDITTAKLAEGTEKAVEACKREEQLLQVREAKLHARLEALSGRVGQSMTRLNAWTDTLLDVIVHRRGPRAIIEANERLGEIHKILCEYEKEK